MLSKELKEKIIEAEKVERFYKNIVDEIKADIIECSGILIRKENTEQNSYYESEILVLNTQIDKLNKRIEFLNKTIENVNDVIKSVFESHTDTKEKRELLPDIYWEIEKKLIIEE